MKTILARIALLSLLVVSLALRQAHAAPPNDANGAAPRPFYIVGHNPNTVEETEYDLQHGCNGLEPDISECTYGPNHPCSDGSGGLRIYHDCGVTPTRSVQTVEEYCASLHQLAITYPNFALVAFDIKGCASTAAYGTKIMNAVRNHLNTNGVNVNVIYSVGSLSDVAVFDNILDKLGPREGVQVDAENNVNDVVNYFRGKGYTGNLTYGDGTTVAFPDGYFYMEHAAFRKSQYGVLKSIAYVFALSSADSMQEYITTGVDGIIPDHDGDIDTCVTVVNGRSDIRMATRADNPWQPKNEAYALYITTVDESFPTTAGTDANLTFTLHGANGSSSLTVDASRNGRMEDAGINYVTIPSKDLGALTSISIKNDGTGSGDDWHVNSIQVASARWLGPAPSSTFYNVTIDAYVNGDNIDHSFNLTLTSNNPYVDAWVDPSNPASNTTSDPTGEIGTPWQQFFSAYTYVYQGGTIHLGGGTYSDLSRIDKPCRIVKEATYPAGNARFIKPPQ